MTKKSPNNFPNNANNNTSNFNDLGLELGFDVPNWQSAKCPDDSILQGKHCRLQPLNLEKQHLDQYCEQLFNAYSRDKENRIWVYLPYGPFENSEVYRAWMRQTCFNGDPYFYAIIDEKRGVATGVASYLNIAPDHGSIEVGHINYSPALQNTIAATEAMYLMMKNAFSLGYRRYEWKCNALNEKSCNAARRLGFTYEGTFRQMLVVKRQNRDTAWFSLLDREWSAIESTYKSWLNADNFNANGVQIKPLSARSVAGL